jgi:hypothetical protein
MPSQGHVHISFLPDLQLRADRFNKLHFKLHDIEHLSETDELWTHRGVLAVVNN